MTVETPRLLLRQYTMEDFDALYEILSDPETMMHYPAPYTRSRQKDGSGGTWRTTKRMASGFGQLP